MATEPESQAAATPPAASPLSIENAKKIEEKVESWWSILTTPSGRVSLAAAAASIVFFLTSILNGLPALRVEIKSMPQVEVKPFAIQSPPAPAKQEPLAPPGPVTSVPTSPKIGIVTFAKAGDAVANDTSLWKWYTDRGHVVQHLTAGSEQAKQWKAYSDKAGYEPCFVVVDARKASDNFLGAYLLGESKEVDQLAKSHIGGGK